MALRECAIADADMPGLAEAQERCWKFQSDKGYSQNRVYGPCLVMFSIAAPNIRGYPKSQNNKENGRGLGLRAQGLGWLA